MDSGFIKRRMGQCIMFFTTLMLLCICAASFGSTADAAEDYLGQMYQRSIDFPEGDLTRLAGVFRKAQRGEEITVGFIGGSITQGFAASTHEGCYASLVHQWWQQAFPLTAVNLVNAGIGGTSSYLGVHRVHEELLDYTPDLIFVEFAVNDTNTEFCMNSYENLIRTILSADNHPAVVLLFSVNALGDGVQAVEAALGEYYNLPMVSYGNAVIPEIAAGSFAWWNIAADIVHPNDMGHSIYAGLVTRYLEAVYARLGTIPEYSGWVMPPAITPQIYAGAHIENADTFPPIDVDGFEIYDFNYHFKRNWYATGEDASITFLVEASNIGLLYQRTVEGTFGLYDVYIDGVYMKTLDGNYVEGYGTETDVEPVYASPEQQRAVHIVRIEKNPASLNTDFVLIGLLIS